MRQTKHGLLFLFPSLIGVSVLILIPFLDVIRRSFTAVLSGNFMGFTNYRIVIENKAFLLAIKNTLRFTAICLPILILTGLFFAVLIDKMTHPQMIKTLFLFPMAIPVAAVVLVWKMVFAKNGFINAFLGTEIDFMASNASFWVLVFSYIWKNLGYTIVLWLAGLSAIPSHLLEAARVDGAGETACFFRIILPNLRTSFYTITVLSFLNSFKVFREAYLVAGSYPHKSMYLLQHLFNNWFLNLELDKMAAAAVMIGIILLGIILLLQKLWDTTKEERT